MKEQKTNTQTQGYVPGAGLEPMKFKVSAQKGVAIKSVALPVAPEALPWLRSLFRTANEEFEVEARGGGGLKIKFELLNGSKTL